jgi:hypothetical protein
LTGRVSTNVTTGFAESREVRSNIEWRLNNRVSVLLTLLAPLAVALAGCGESRRSTALPDGGTKGGGGTSGSGATSSGATNGGETGNHCADCDGGTCVNGLCCNGTIGSLSALAGVPCSTAGQFCGPGDCTQSDTGIVSCTNGICSENYQCSSDGAGNLQWVFQPGVCLH